MEDIQKKRMELFHYEYQREQQHYQQRKEKEDDEKLCAILKYTRDTFKPFGFDEAEIFQICECVRYFVINRHVLTMTKANQETFICHANILEKFCLEHRLSI